MNKLDINSLRKLSARLGTVDLESLTSRKFLDLVFQEGSGYLNVDKKSTTLTEIETPEIAPPTSSALTAHIFYDEFADRLINAWEQQSDFQMLYVTTPSPGIASYLKRKFGSRKSLEIVLCENRGRNFGPLLVELFPRLRDFDIFGHIHSKRTLHADQNLGRSWADDSWGLVLEEGLLRRQAISILASSNISLAYALPPKEIRSINFYWNSNIKFAKMLSRELGIPDPKKGRLYFPVGGMFLASTKKIKIFMDKKWSYSTFRAEDGRVDGTTQHAFERLLGYYVFYSGLGQVVYDKKTMSWLSITKNK